MCANRLLMVVALTFAVIAVQTRANEPWPVGMSFVALQDGKWQLFVVPPGKQRPQRVSLMHEPRTPAYSPSIGKIAYISPQGDVLLHDLATGRESALLEARADTGYTQPSFAAGKNHLLLVELQQGRSRSTRILAIDLQTGEQAVWSQQRSAQFHPLAVGDFLYYTNVHCVENCAGRYVHEIWAKNLISQDARQLTLLNTLTQQPAVAADGGVLYVSSEKQGGKQIWKCALNNEPPLSCESMTSGGVADTHPVVSTDGTVYFLRLLSDGRHAIMRAVGKARAAAMQTEMTDIRDLEIGR
ncbi:MAG TPA: hypothetical protein ENJ24_05430 [Gammaproteobacteria bacterium]|nr:hypothetical protein [Gammaproteobacteria bacterium]